MKFILPVICLSTGILALPASNEKRDISLISNSLKEVANGLSRLEASIRSIRIKMNSPQVAGLWPEVERNCHYVTELLYNDAKSIRRAPVVTALESPALLAPITNLETLTTRVIDDWIAIKRVIAAKDRSVIQNILKDHQAAAGEYADAILSRQNALTAPVGRLFGSRTKQTIQRGINSYRI
jgi:hypothetical protein